MKPVVWLDSETTGLIPGKHGIVSISAIIEVDGEALTGHTFHMNPEGREIEDSALAVNGFTREQIAGFPNWATVAPEFIRWMVDTLGESAFPILTAGYNHGFDMRHVDAWFKAAGFISARDVFSDSLELDVCTMVKANAGGLFGGLENRKLTTVAKSLDIDMEGGAHTAEVDIWATREVYLRILKAKEGAPC